MFLIARENGVLIFVAYQIVCDIQYFSSFDRNDESLNQRRYVWNISDGVYFASYLMMIDDQLMMFTLWNARKEVPAQRGRKVCLGLILQILIPFLKMIICDPN